MIYLVVQTAELTQLTIGVNKLLRVVLKGSASDVLGDVDITLTQGDIDVDLDDVLKLLPRGMVPVAAAGNASLRDVRVKARLSELTALTPFDAHLALKLDNVVAAGEGFDVAGANAKLDATLTRADRSRPISRCKRRPSTPVAPR